MAQLGNGEGLNAALGAMASQLAARELDEVLKEMTGQLGGDSDSTKLVANLVQNIASSVIGLTVGGESGANLASMMDRYNRQQHPIESATVLELLPEFMDILKQEGITNLSEEEALALLEQIALYNTDESWAKLMKTKLAQYEVDSTLAIAGVNLGSEPGNPPKYSVEVYNAALDYIISKSDDTFIVDGIEYNYFGNKNRPHEYYDASILSEYIGDNSDMVDFALLDRFRIPYDMTPTVFAYDRAVRLVDGDHNLNILNQPKSVQEKLLADLNAIFDNYINSNQTLYENRDTNPSYEFEMDYNIRMAGKIAELIVLQSQEMGVDDKGDPHYFNVDALASLSRMQFSLSGGAGGKGRVYNSAKANTSTTTPDGATQQKLSQSTRAKNIGNAVSTIRSKISPQKQARHIIDTPEYQAAGGNKSYFNKAQDAQQVLDAVKSGQAKILGTDSHGNVTVEFKGVTGYNNNPSTGHLNQPTNIFTIKGTKSPSVVPQPPTWRQK